MKRIVVFLLIASIISGCAATHKTARDAPVVDAGRVTAVRGAKKGVDLLAVGTQTIKTRKSVHSAPVATVDNLLSRADERLVTINGHLALESITPDTIISQVTSLIGVYKGQLVVSTDLQIEIRIPAECFGEVVKRIRNLGRVVSYKIVGQDINDNFQDNEMRLENNLKTRERLLSLFADAINVEEVLKVERELGRLNGGIDNLKRSLRKLSTDVELARIKVQIVLPNTTKPGPVGSVFYYAYKGISWLFINK